MTKEFRWHAYLLVCVNISSMTWRVHPFNNIYIRNYNGLFHSLFWIELKRPVWVERLSMEGLTRWNIPYYAILRISSIWICICYKKIMFPIELCIFLSNILEMKNSSRLPSATISQEKAFRMTNGTFQEEIFKNSVLHMSSYRNCHLWCKLFMGKQFVYIMV